MRLTRALAHLAIALAVLASVALVPATSVSADDWCWNDPVVSIDGYTVQILTGVRGSTTEVDTSVDLALVKIIVPYGTQTRVISTTNYLYSEFAYFQQTAPSTSGSGANRRRDDDTPVRVEVTFIARKQLPAQMKVISQGKTHTVNGNTKTPLVVEFTIDR